MGVTPPGSPPGAGRLVLVATPIGNLGDLAPRAAEILASADVIACEDTRRTGLLLTRQGIARRRLIVVNEHTETERVPEILALLAEGRTVALVSDAGSPGVSDPGQRLVAAALDAGFVVTGVPGPSAAVLALTISGLATARWVFEGFVPRKGPARRERLAQIATEARTVVLYEAPHRLARTLTDLAALCGDERPVVIARELTKLHEELWRGTLGQAAARVAAAEPVGEHVIVLAGAPPDDAPDEATIDEALEQRLAAGMTVRDAADAVAGELGAPRRLVYARALEARSRTRTTSVDPT